MTRLAVASRRALSRSIAGIAYAGLLACATTVLAQTEGAMRTLPPLSQQAPDVVDPTTGTPRSTDVNGPPRGDAAASRQGLQLEPDVMTRMTWTNNAAFSSGTGTPQSDTIGEVRPTVGVRYEGPHAHAGGSVGFDAVGYARGTEKNRVLPQVLLDGSIELSDRRAFVDGGVRSFQTAENAFQARSLGTTTYNQYTTTQTRLSPHFEDQIRPDLSASLRSDNTWTTSQANTTSVPRGYYGRQRVAIDQKPLPLGGRLEYQYDSTQYTGSSGPSLTQEFGRLVVDYAIATETLVAVRGGYEQDRFSASRIEKSFYGVGATWRPTERTEFDGYWEKHDYANVWDAHLSHRMPRLAFYLASSRFLTTYAQTIFTLTGAGDLPSLLDAALTTRIADPNARSAAVRQIIDRQGLGTTFGAPVDVASEGFQIALRNAVSLAVLGVRDTVALSAYSTRTQAVLAPGTLVPDSAFNNTQQGFEVNGAHRLSEISTLSLALAWTRTQGLVSPQQSDSRQTGLLVQLTRQLGPRTVAAVGARRQRIVSNVAPSASETAAFVELNHRF